MPDRKMQKHTLNLYAGDFDRLRAIYPEVGAAVAVRRLIRKHLEDVERRTQPKIPLEMEVDL